MPDTASMPLGDSGDPARIEADEEPRRGSSDAANASAFEEPLDNNDASLAQPDDDEADESPLLLEKPSYIRQGLRSIKSFGDVTLESMRESSPVPIKQLVAIW